jgi:predicted Rossmann-fold nucleotide-binding protein
LAAQAGIKPRLVVATISPMAGRIMNEAGQAAVAFPGDVGTIEPIMAVIQGRVQLVLASLETGAD